MATAAATNRAALPMHDLVGEVSAEADHPPSDDTAEDQRDTDAGGRGDTGLPGVRAEDVELERRPHQKHVEHESELADDVDDREVRDGRTFRPRWSASREQPLLPRGPHPSQYRRAEQESGHHDRDHLHLAEAAEQRPEQPIGQEDDGDLEEEVGGDRSSEGGISVCPTSGTRTGRRSDRRRSTRPAPGISARAPSCLPVRRRPSRGGSSTDRNP